MYEIYVTSWNFPIYNHFLELRKVKKKNSKDYIGYSIYIKGTNNVLNKKIWKFKGDNIPDHIDVRIYLYKNISSKLKNSL